MVEVTRRTKRQPPQKRQETTPETPKRKEFPNEASTLRKWIEPKVVVDIHLKTGKTLTGVILWFDTYYILISIRLVFIIWEFRMH